MSRRTIKGKKFLWHHITKMDASDVEFLRENFQFHILDFEDLATENPIPKLDTYKHYLFAVFQIPRWNKKFRVATDDLQVFFGADYVVTITKHPIEAVEMFFSRSERNAKFRNDSLGRGAGYLFYKLLRYVFYNAQSVVRDLVKQVGEVEESVYNVHDRETTRSLAYIRRDILFLRSVVDPQRSMITLIANSQKNYLDSELGVFFDDVRDTLDTMWTVTENAKQGVDGLFEVNDSLLTHRTNDVVTLFTAVAAALMPSTLIAGVYGMNVSWLPFSENPGGVILFILMVAIVSFVAVFTLLKRYR